MSFSPRPLPAKRRYWLLETNDIFLHSARSKVFQSAQRATHCRSLLPLEELFSLAFVHDATNVILVGPNGVGKTDARQKLFH